MDHTLAIFLCQWSSVGNNFAFQQTSGSIWRHFRLSQLGERELTTSSQWVEARDANKHLTAHRTPLLLPHKEYVQNVNFAKAKKFCFMLIKFLTLAYFQTQQNFSHRLQKRKYCICTKKTKWWFCAKALLSCRKDMPYGCISEPSP